MAFHGLSFPNQNVSALDDGGFYRSFRGDGIIQGCEITFTNNSITMQAGWLIAGGRLIQIDGATTFTFEDMITTGYGRLMLQIDTSQTSTVEVFEQLSFPIDYSASVDGFSAPMQEDINLGGGTIYQMVLAIVQISGGNITAITSSISLSRVGQKWTDGVVRSRLFTSNGGGGIQFIDSNGDYSIGVYGSKDNDSLWLYSEGANGIRLNPSGINSSVGSISFLPDGQQVGGHPIIEKTVTGLSTTLDGTTRTLFEVPEVAGTGQYMGVFHVCVNNVSGATPIYLRADDWVDMPYMQAGNWNHWYTMPFMYKGTAGSYLIVRGDLNTGNTAKLTQWKMRAIKL